MLNFVRTLIIATALTATSAVAAGQTCAPRDTIIDQIGKRYGEGQEGIGLTPAGTLVEVFVSDKGTWTILLSTPQGNSCIAAVGENWEWVERKLGPEESY
jgi:hypothetical protein